MPSIDRSSSEPFYRQVYTQIAEGIEAGLYPTGKKLPSIRECARELGVSNTTIELAYQKLTAEGYITARRGSGYSVCKIETSLSKLATHSDVAYREALKQLKEAENERSQKLKLRYDFAYDAIDRSLFPLTPWARISREVFYMKGFEDALLYNDHQGLAELRVQIAQYVSGEHDIACVPEQILVMPTTRDLISAVTSLFDITKSRFAMENPGYDEVASWLRLRGFDISWLPVSPYPHWKDMQDALEGARFVFVTPSCQFPTNQFMPLEMRRKLVEWARDHDAYIFDDEYGWEYLSGVTHMPALAALDNAGRVVTVGTFSNVLSPAINLSFAVLPPQLMLKWQEKNRRSHSQVPWQTQATMATFIAEERLRTHIRKMRTAMAQKRTALIEALEDYMGDSIEAIPGSGSLFVLIRTLDERDEATLIEEARKNDVVVYPTSQYWQGDVPADWRYVLVGYAGIAKADIKPGIHALADAWGFATS